MLAAPLAAALLALLKLFPRSGAAMMFDRLVVRPLAVRMATLERRHVIFALLMILVLVAAADVVAMAGPLDTGLLLLWDVSSYLDAILVTATLASVARLRPLRHRLRLPSRHRSVRSRAARHRRLRTHRTADRPSNDDEPSPARAVA